MANKGFTMKVKTANGYVSLYPQTLLEKIDGFNIGSVYKQIVTLSTNNWQDLQQTVDVTDILESDTPMVNKILEGTPEQMRLQENAFNTLDPIVGVYSFDGKVRFTCKTLPQVDFKVQIYWTR